MLGLIACRYDLLIVLAKQFHWFADFKRAGHKFLALADDELFALPDMLINALRLSRI